MSVIHLRIVGAVRALAIVNSIKHMAETQHRGQWWVATVVDYAELVEFGTQKMPARPAWREAIQRLIGEVTLNQQEADYMINATLVGGDLTKKVAMKLKAEIRRQIKTMGAIDTGNYYGSIGVGRTRAEALQDSINKLIDPSSSVVI